MKHLLLFVVFLVLAACENGAPEFVVEEGADAQGHTAPTAETARLNVAAGNALPIADNADFEAARRGLIASDPDLVVRDREGNVAWNMPACDFMEGDAPASVNPSLWRQGKLNNIHGLFKVTDRVYQLRGFDLANMTLIEGDSGWIVVDPLTVTETGGAAWEFARKHLVGDKPITAVLFTHSNIKKQRGHSPCVLI